MTEPLNKDQISIMQTIPDAGMISLSASRIACGNGGIADVITKMESDGYSHPPADLYCPAIYNEFVKRITAMPRAERNAYLFEPYNQMVHDGLIKSANRFVEDAYKAAQQNAATFTVDANQPHARAFRMTDILAQDVGMVMGIFAESGTYDPAWTEQLNRVAGECSARKGQTPKNCSAAGLLRALGVKLNLLADADDTVSPVPVGVAPQNSQVSR